MESLGGLPVNTATPPALMMTVGDIARRDGITVAAVSKAVARLADKHGLAVQRDHRNRVIGVNVAQYDDLRGKYADPAHDQAPRKEKDTSYEDARTRQALYDGERSRIKLAQEIGELVWRADIEHAAGAAGERIGRELEQLVGEVDELAAAYSQGGLQALRVKLRDLVHKARTGIANALDELVVSSPATTPSPDDAI